MVIMHCLTFIYLNTKDWIIVGISFAGSIIWSYIWFRILYSLKPNLNIESVNIKEDQCIKIKVINNGKHCDAININIEACVVCGDKTYHLDIDRSNFLILPKKDNRVFQSYDLAQSAKKYYKENFSSFVKTKIKDENTIIRIRIHANHAYSGFGRAFEANFQYNKERDALKEIKRAK